MSVSCSDSPWEITLPVFFFLLWWSQTLRNVGGRGLWKSSSTSSCSKQGYSHNCMRWTIAIAESSKQPRTGVSYTDAVYLWSVILLSLSLSSFNIPFRQKTLDYYLCWKSVIQPRLHWVYSENAVILHLLLACLKEGFTVGFFPVSRNLLWSMWIFLD